ncbi:hypothetical protein ABIF97_004085 [Bradyrhizobium japonicum]
MTVTNSSRSNDGLPGDADSQVVSTGWPHNEVQASPTGWAH